jgi:hypothetical protein
MNVVTTIILKSTPSFPFYQGWCDNMLDFLFSRSGELLFESVTEKEHEVLELIRIDKKLAKKYYKLYKYVQNTTAYSQQIH